MQKFESGETVEVDISLNNVRDWVDGEYFCFEEKHNRHIVYWESILTTFKDSDIRPAQLICDECLTESSEREYSLEQQNAKLVETLEESRERFRDIEINYNCIDVVNISMDSQIKIDEILAEVKGE